MFFAEDAPTDSFQAARVLDAARIEDSSFAIGTTFQNRTLTVLIACLLGS